jgi:hypothetical protein
MVVYVQYGRSILLIQRQLSVLVELLELQPTPIEVDTLSWGYRCLTKFDAIIILLQRDVIPFIEVHNIFNVLIGDFLEMQHHLGVDSSLVVDKDLEMGVIGISKGLPLTVQQHAAVVNLVKAEEQPVRDANDRTANQMPLPSAQHDDNKNYAERVMKRLKMQAMENFGRDQDVNLDVIPETSVNCERLFSLAKHILTDTRKNTSPILFEVLLFLKVNRSLWDSTTVSKAMGRTRCEHDEAADGDKSADVADDNNDVILLGYDIAIDNDDAADEKEEDKEKHYLLMS